MAIAMTRPVICPSSVPITVAAVPVAVGGAPLTGNTLWSICHVQSSPGSRADQLMLKVEELGAGACAKAASGNRKRRARASAKGSGLRTVMGGLQADGRGWPRAARTRTEKSGGFRGRRRRKSSREDYRPKPGLGEGLRRSALRLKVCWTAEKSFCTTSLPLSTRSSNADWPSLIPGRVFAASAISWSRVCRRARFGSPRGRDGGRQGGACLRVIGDGAGRLVISRGETLVMGEDGVELLAQILELAAGTHFGEDVLDPPIGFGGVADSGENSSRLLPLKRLQARR